MNANIELKKGFGDLLFGQSIGQVIELVGKPDQVEQIGEDVEMPTTVLHYEELQMSLFFDTAPEEHLVCIDVESPEATLFGEKIMGKSRSGVLELMKRNGFGDACEETEAWGEERVGFEDCSVDFYFDDGLLESLTIGR